MSTEDRRHKDVADELRRVAERRINEVFDARGKSNRNLKNLIEITQKRHPSLWQNNPTEALTKVITDAADKLPNEKIHDKTEMTWRELAWGLYNLNGDDLNHVDGRGYPYLLRITFEQARIGSLPDGTRRNITRRLRSRLAAKLLGEPRPPEQEESASPQSVANEIQEEFGDIPKQLGGYIRRRQYHARFRPESAS